MKPKFKMFIVALFFVIACMTVVACSNNSESDVVSITNKPENGIIAITDEKDQYQLSVSNAENLSWESSNENIAEVSDSGLLTLKNEGVTEITAFNEQMSDSFLLTVQDNRTYGALTITGLPENNELNLNSEAIQLNYNYEGDGDFSFSYLSSNPSVATVSAQGVLTPISQGSTTITVACNERLKLKTSVLLNVIGNRAETITIENIPAYNTILKGNSYELTVSVLPSDSMDSDIVWSSSDTDKAIINENGQITALNTGNVDITARLENNENISDTITLQIDELKDYSENFKYASIKDGMIVDIGPEITYQNSQAEIIEFEEDRALQLTTKANGQWNEFDIKFKGLSAGNYKFTLKFKVESGDYTGEIIKGSGAAFTTIWKTIKNNDDYSFYFNIDAVGDCNFKFTTVKTDASATVIIDDILLEKVASEIPAIQVKSSYSEDFNKAELASPYLVECNGTLFMPDSYTSVALVSDDNGGQALRITKSDKTEYGAIAYSFGEVPAGRYKLTLDLYGDKQEQVAIIQLFKLSWENGYLNGEVIHADDYIDKVASISRNTYELFISLSEDHTNFAFGLALNQNTSSSITIDNLKLEKLNCVEETFDGTIDSKNYGTDVPTGGYAGIYLAGRSTTSTVFSDGGAVAKQKNGSLTVTGDTSNWKAVYLNVGYVKAGTYKVSIDYTLSTGNFSGHIMVRKNNDTAVAYKTLNECKEEDSTYSFKITVEADIEKLLIGFASNQMDAFEITLDNFKFEELK